MAERQRRQKTPRTPLVMAYGTKEQKQKLAQLAGHLRVSNSNLVGLLIENAFDEIFIKENQHLLLALGR